MARSREFDTDLVLLRAAETFGRFGYAGTSIDALVAATGLQRGSLYGAFDSKARLFARAFEHVVERSEAMDLVADLLIAGMWDRAAVDEDVRDTARAAVAKLETATGRAISDVLFDRLEARAHPEG